MNNLYDAYVECVGCVDVEGWGQHYINRLKNAVIDLDKYTLLHCGEKFRADDEYFGGTSWKFGERDSACMTTANYVTRRLNCV